MTNELKNQPDTHTRLGILVIIYPNIFLSSLTIYSGATFSMYCQCWDFHPKDRNRCLNKSFTIYRFLHYWPVRLLVNYTATVVSYQQVPGISPNTCWLITSHNEYSRTLCFYEYIIPTSIPFQYFHSPFKLG